MAAEESECICTRTWACRMQKAASSSGAADIAAGMTPTRSVPEIAPVVSARSWRRLS